MSGRTSVVWGLDIGEWDFGENLTVEFLDQEPESTQVVSNQHLIHWVVVHCGLRLVGVGGFKAWANDAHDETTVSPYHVSLIGEPHISDDAGVTEVVGELQLALHLLDPV